LNSLTTPIEVDAVSLEDIFGGLKVFAGTAPDRFVRLRQLDSLERLLRENIDAIADAIGKDFGSRSRHETRLLEIFPALEAIAHAKRHLKSWMKPRRGWASMWFLPARTEIRYQPLGVVGIIVPWNYPVLLAFAPLTGAIAAGNRAMIKMSELAPHTGELLASLVTRYLGEDTVAVINGGSATGKAFAALPFDHLLFTGSGAVGRQVMHAAAENLTPITLELGGKSPAIVGEDFPIALAAQKILFGKCLNAGQTCIAPDYVLLPRDKINDFMEAARAAVAKRYPTLKDNPDYSAVVNAQHVQRLMALCEDARDQGARIMELNPAGENLADCRKIAPTLLTRIGDNMRVMQEEIFGPLLPLVGYGSIDEAIGYVNARPHPLALYFFSHDRANIERVLNETVAGGVTINETILHISQETLPFGGVGASGMGHYHGRFGLEAFSKQKAVFHQSRLNGLGLFHPPFGRRFENLLKLLLR
jgi:acyl-CoA reductase-like NAD-dependent aldehyde dehydrogenase